MATECEFEYEYECECRYEESGRADFKTGGEGEPAEPETERERERGRQLHWCIYRDMECDPDSCLWYEDGICDGSGPIGPWRLRGWRR